MTLFLPRLTKSDQPSLRVWRQRRAIAAPIGKVFPKSRSSFLHDAPDEKLDLTTKSLIDKNFVQLAEDGKYQSTEEIKKYEYNKLQSNLPELPSLPGDRRGPGKTKPPVVETPQFYLQGASQQKSMYNVKVENTPGGLAFKKICYELQPWIENIQSTIDDEGQSKDLRKLLFIKKMRIYLEVRKKAFSPEMQCVPIFHCPRCLEHWTLTGEAPETCDNDLQPTRGPEVIVKGTRLRFIPMYQRKDQHRITKAHVFHPSIGKRNLKNVMPPSINISHKTDEHIAKTIPLPSHVHTGTPSRDIDKSRDIDRSIDDFAEELTETSSGVFTVDVQTGEKIHVNRDILNSLTLNGLDDEEAIKQMLESGAVVLGDMIPREPPMSLVRALSFTNHQYDDYARSKKNSHDTIDREASDAPRENASFVDITKGKMDLETGENVDFDLYSELDNEDEDDVMENIKVNVNYRTKNLSETDKNAHDTSKHINKYIRPKDIPDNIKEKLIKILYLQRQRKRRKNTLNNHKHLKQSDSKERNNETECVNEVGLAMSDERFRQATSQQGRVPYQSHSTGTKPDDSKSRSNKVKRHKELASNQTTNKQTKLAKPTILWEGQSNVKESETIVSNDYTLHDAEENSVENIKPTKQIISNVKQDHFKEASEVLKYREKQRRPPGYMQYQNASDSHSTGKTPLGTRPIIDTAVTRNQGRIPAGNRNDSFSYSRRQSSTMGWSDVESFTQVSSHMMYARKGSKSIEHQQDDKRRLSLSKKKEKSTNVRRISRGRHSIQKDTASVQDDMEHSHVNVANAGEWFDHEEALLCETDLKPKQAEEKPPIGKHARQSIATSSLVVPLQEPKRGAKRETIKCSVRAMDEEFNVAMGDIRSEVVEIKGGDGCPVISVIKEKDESSPHNLEAETEEKVMFEEIPNPSRVSLFSKWDFQEMIRPPVSSAFSFSFYELPAQYKENNRKLEEASVKMAKRKRKPQKITRL